MACERKRGLGVSGIPRKNTHWDNSAHSERPPTAPMQLKVPITNLPAMNWPRFCAVAWIMPPATTPLMPTRMGILRPTVSASQAARNGTTRPGRKRRALVTPRMLESSRRGNASNSYHVSATDICVMGTHLWNGLKGVHERAIVAAHDLAHRGGHDPEDVPAEARVLPPSGKLGTVRRNTIANLARTMDGCCSQLRCR